MGRVAPTAVLIIALLVTSLCAGCGSPVAAHPSPTTHGTSSDLGAATAPAWIITAGSLPRLSAAGLPDQVLSADFDNRDALVLGAGRIDDLAPDATPAMVFTSETTLAAALNGGQVGAAVSWLLLDLEDWPLTPASEQQDPIGTLRAAVAVAHAHSRKILFTPAVDLLSVVAPGTPAAARFSTFDRLIAGPGAALADGFEVQSQQTEGTSSATTFISQAIAAARAAHPGAPVLAGLSTNPDGRRVTAADLLALYRAAQSAGATGFWLNIPQASSECPACGVPQTPVAVAFLRDLAPTPAGDTSP